VSHTRFQLHTPRLVLRDFIVDDWPMIYALSQEQEVTRYQTWLRLSGEAEARQWVERAINHNQREPRQAYNLAVVTRHDATAIGWLGWGRASDATKGHYDFGYALLPRAWGNGYMTEALQAAITFMFEELGAQQVSGECVEANQASARVMQNAGLQLVAQWYEDDPNTGLREKHSRYARQPSQPLP
jgi:[ribosomal protein S5]-alanine N-acetyltransferase